MYGFSQGTCATLACKFAMCQVVFQTKVGGLISVCTWVAKLMDSNTTVTIVTYPSIWGKKSWHRRSVGKKQEEKDSSKKLPEIWDKDDV